MSHNRNLTIKSTRTGRGVIAMKPFSPKEICFEVTGKRVTLEEEWLTKKMRDNTFRYNKTYYLSPKGTIGDFLNHSCEPNSLVKKVGSRLFVVALDPIDTGQEVSIDYSTILADDDVWEMACQCGKSTCRGTIGQFKSLPKTLKTKYRRLGAVPSYIDPRRPRKLFRISKT